MQCRRCGQTLQAHSGLRLGVRTTTFENLVFRCEHCGIGYSNASREENRVEITATPEANVPAEVVPRP